MARFRLNPSRLSLAGRLTLLLSLGVILVIGFDIFNLKAAREERLAQAVRETANLARSLSEYAQSTFQIADTILVGLRERVSVDGTGQQALERLGRIMRLRMASEPIIHGLFLIDEHGDWLATSVPSASHAINYADRDYFAYHRDHDDGAVFVGTPVRSKVDNSPIITLSRRLNHPDGSFAGVVEATIDPALFQHFYETFDIGGDGAIVLTNSHGIILARSPFGAENVGRDISVGGMFQPGMASTIARSSQFVGLIDGKARLGSFHRVLVFDLMVIVSRGKNEVLAPWWHELGSNLFWLGLAIVSIGALGARLVVQVRKHASVEALYRLLADNSGDVIVCTGLDGSRRYISPAFYTLTGWTEQSFAGRATRDIVHPDDRHIVQTTLDALARGTSHVSPRYRYLRPDGSSVWVEMRAVLARGSDGQPATEFVGNIRDITLQKAAEDDLAEANAGLAAMTLTDPLTDIANRRHFEQTLRREWNRAMRNGSSLALLMIDIDHFKAFNDLYGHVLGDACLRAVAGIIADAARRSGDLAARYGGEEFAVIVPETRIETAALLAERMMDTLRRTGIVHGGTREGIVTISIGVSALVPTLTTPSSRLVESADAALYEAKLAGRNRSARAKPDIDLLPAIAAE